MVFFVVNRNTAQGIYRFRIHVLQFSYEGLFYKWIQSKSVGRALRSIPRLYN